MKIAIIGKYFLIIGYDCIIIGNGVFSGNTNDITLMSKEICIANDILYSSCCA